MAENRSDLELVLSTGGFALLVTWVGLYAVTAYLVSRRLREFGLMRALGARDRDIYSSVVTPVLRTVGIGASSGILVSVALAGLARHYVELVTVALAAGPRVRPSSRSAPA